MRLIDSSVAVKWFVAEEQQSAAEALIGTALIAPDLLMIEVSNAMWKKWRKQEIDVAQAAAAQSIVTSFVELVPSRPFAESALAIAIELEHPVYDCVYLAMAEATAHPVITADKRLLARCAGTRFEPMLVSL
jgi:predicted nucleic acid-binding protein